MRWHRPMNGKAILFIVCVHWQFPVDFQNLFYAYFASLQFRRIFLLTA